MTTSDEQHKIISKLKNIALKLDQGIEKGEIDIEFVHKSQLTLSKLAETILNDQMYSSSVYIVYEVQALIHWVNDEFDEAYDLINSAKHTKGKRKLITANGNYLLSNLKHGRSEIQSSPARFGDQPSYELPLPLQLQSLIKSTRMSANIMVIVTTLSIFFIPWAIYYARLARKLNPEEFPGHKLIKEAAIATLPLYFSLIPLLIGIEFWRTTKKLKNFEERGLEAFLSDEEFSVVDAKQKRNNAIVLKVLLAIILLLVIVLFGVVIT